MSILDTLIYGYRTALAAGVEVTRRNKLNFLSPLTAVDNPTLGTTDVDIGSGFGTPGGSSGDIQGNNGAGGFSAISSTAYGKTLLSLADAAALNAAIQATRVTALDANHLHAWELDEASGNFVDTGSSASKVNLTAAGSPVYGTKGIFGSCPLFGISAIGAASSSTATALVSSFSDLPTTNVSLECWFRSYTTIVNHLVGFEYTGGAASTFSIDASGSTGALLGNTEGGSTKTATTISNATFTQMVWHHVALVYDHGTGTVYLYLDGEVVGRATGQTSAIAWASGTTPTFTIGKGLGATQFQGQLSKVRLSNIARSSSYMRGVYGKAIAA